MIIGSAHSLVQPRISPLQRALSCFPITEGFARLDSSFGSGGLYYADRMIKTFSDVIANPTAGEPISVGMVVDGSEAPTLVQGVGAELVPNSEFETGTVDWADQDSSLAAVGGEMIIAKNTGVQYGYANATVPVEIGKAYRITATVRCGTCDQVRLAMTDAIARNNGSDNTASTSPVSIEYEGVATTTNLGLQFVVITSGMDAANAIVDNVSVKEILPHPGFSTEDRLGGEIGPNADEPQSWEVNNAVTADNADGSRTVASTGVHWHRIDHANLSVVAGVRCKYEIRYRAGTSGRARVVFSNDGLVSDLSGVVGSLAIGQMNAGTLTITNQTLVNGLHTVSGDFVPEDATNTCRLGVGPDSTTAGEDIVVISGSLKQIYRDHTVKIVWDAEGTTGDRIVWNARKDANDRLTLHFVSGILRLESFVSGVSEGFVGVPGVDDGGRHNAVLYWDEVSKGLSVRVDGGSLATATAASVPTNLNQFALGHLDGANQLNGLVLEHAAANGDQIAA